MPASPRLALAVTVVLWAGAFPAIRVAVPELGAAGLSVARLLVASIALALWPRSSASGARRSATSP